VVKKIVLAVVVLSMMNLCPAFAQDETIGMLLKERIPVKVYIKSVVNESGKDQITAEAYKKVLETVFLNRKAMKFVIVNTPAESDIQVSVAIKKYQYLKRGPFKPSPGIDTMLLDAAASATENYVEMTAEYTVVDTRDGKTLWKSDVYEYVKRIMTPEKSIPIIYDKISRTFMWKCFGKARLEEKIDSLLHHQIAL